VKVPKQKNNKARDNNEKKIQINLQKFAFSKKNMEKM
jgi:hypothetical protein